MLNKRTQFLIALLVVSVVYSWLTLFVFEDSSDYEISFTRSNVATQQNTQINNTAPTQNIDIRAGSQSPNNMSNQTMAASTSLPKTFLLRGALAEAEDVFPTALIEFRGGLTEYELGNYILDTDMRITRIANSNIVVEYNNQDFTIDLTPPNLLAPDFRKPSESRAKLLNMTPKEIGARPRIIEHMLVLTPTPYIADGRLVHPGLNPDLFRQAGFQEDDVLKTINGKSVTIEHELEEIKKELLDAQTLTFQVMRKGRIITLYLDIPSEALDVSYD
jgi:general secretion pathway protein C